MKKKKVIFHSDFALAKTGFGRNTRAVLTYLHKTGKYELINLCCGMQANNSALSKTPWKSVGVLPANSQEMEQINRDPNLSRMAGYGAYCIDKFIAEEKPDVYFGVQDIWGIDYSIDKHWFNNISSVIWTTLDSLPILPSAVEKAPKIKNYWIWSSFAEKELHKLGHTHVKTLHGAIESESFHRLPSAKRKELRARFSIPEKAYVVGFVFRNQLRKGVYNLIEGYSMFKKKNPTVETRLLLHTHLSEGWDIPKLAAEYGVDYKEIIVTYICRACKRYEVKSFDNRPDKYKKNEKGEYLIENEKRVEEKYTLEEKDCPYCRRQGSQITTNVGLGISESELNEVYNLMDVYCHPFTSGGQEIPIQEAKLVELITLVTNYSCGEELCEEGSESLVLDWAEYREPGTQFIKASTLPSSIAKQLEKVYQMDESKRNKLGKKARQWILDNFSIEVIGKKLEEFIDSCPTTNYDFLTKEKPKNPNAIVPDVEDNSQWVSSLYKLILNADVDAHDDGHKSWMQQLKVGAPRKSIESFFRQVAAKDQEKVQVNFEEMLGKDDAGRRILYVMPESIGDVYLSTSLFKSLKELYPNSNLYVATKQENLEVLDGNPYVFKVIPYFPQMDNLLWLEGIGKHKGFFEIAFLPYFGTQKMLDYVHNGRDKIAFEIK